MTDRHFKYFENLHIFRVGVTLQMNESNYEVASMSDSIPCSYSTAFCDRHTLVMISHLIGQILLIIDILVLNLCKNCMQEHTKAAS